MKKILILFLLVPFFSFAKYYDATIKFNNGNTFKGLMEIPKMTNQILIYKSSEDSKVEKYKIDEIDQIEFFFKDGGTRKLVATLYYGYDSKSKLLVLSGSKVWLDQIYDGKLKIYKAKMQTYLNNKNGETLYTLYFFNKPNEKYPQNVFPETDLISIERQFKVVKATLGEFMKEDCPKLVDMIEKKDIKEKSYARIGELYDQNCGK